MQKIDIIEFQKEVLDVVKEITSVTRTTPRKVTIATTKSERAAPIGMTVCRTRAAMAKKPIVKANAARWALTGTPSKKMPLISTKRTTKEKKGITEATKKRLHSKAQRLLKDRKLLTYLCPALRGLTGDIAEVAKALTIALVPLSLSGTIAVPLNPYLYGMLAFVVCKSGIEVLCKDY